MNEDPRKAKSESNRTNSIIHTKDVKKKKKWQHTSAWNVNLFIEFKDEIKIKESFFHKHASKEPKQTSNSINFNEYSITHK